MGNGGVSLRSSMTSPALGAAPRRGIRASVIVGFSLLLLTGRHLSAHFVAFFGLDDISLASGVPL
jgi:hypothetical protein